MLTPFRMKEISLRLPLAREEGFLEDVSRFGILQVKEIKYENLTPGFSKDSSSLAQEESRLEGLIARCDATLGRLPKAGVIGQLLKKEESSPVSLSRDREDKVYQDAEQTLKEMEDRTSRWESLKKAKLGSGGQLAAKISSLLSNNLAVVRRTSSSDYFLVFEGWVRARDLMRLEDIIREATEGNFMLTAQESRILKNREVQKVGIVILLSHYGKLESAFAASGIVGFEPEVFQQFASISNQIEETIETGPISRNLMVLREVLSNRLQIVKAETKTAKSTSVALLEGWVKEKDIDRLTSMLKAGKYDYGMSIEDPKSEELDDVPTALDNPPFINSFEVVTSMFGYPKYGSIDPTPILAVTFMIFFGLMFADIFDGLLLLAFSLLLYRGLGSKSEGGKKLSELLIGVSLSSMLFGLLTGEFMGGMVNLPVLWFSGFDDPMYFLVLAVAMGIGQLTIGLLIGAVNELSRKGIWAAIADKLSWLFLLYGLILVFLHFYLLSDVIYLYAGSMLAVLGLLILLTRDVMNVMELTRLISNVVSYARIVAINMSHVGIARAFTILVAPMISSGGDLVGLVAGGAILLIGHLFVVFIETFVAFAHSLRLHYVEFFSKFFEPTENAFRPLAQSRKFTKVM
jgi:vacuolar-type H+-ATPase subunit I/STV1